MGDWGGAADRSGWGRAVATGAHADGSGGIRHEPMERQG